MPDFALIPAAMLLASSPAALPQEGLQGPPSPTRTTQSAPLPGGQDPQSVAGQGAAPASHEGSPSVGAPPKTDGPITRFQKSNAIGKGLRALEQDGVDLTLDWVENFAGNPVGGVSQGFAESHWVMGEADLDLDKLVGLPDTRVQVQGAWFTGDSLGRENIGNSISFQQTWRPVSGPRLTRLTIEHDFLDKKLNLMVGRAPVNSYFNNSPLNCVFMSNTACLTTYGAIADIGITAYPNSSWAAKVRYALTDKLYVQTGAFEYNNDLNLKGKGGLDFSLGKGSGVLVPGEIGYQTTFANDRLPRRYKLGFYFNSDGGKSPYFDANGNSAVLTGLPFAPQSGSRLGVYIMGDQTISRPDPNSKRNLAAFGRLYFNAGNAAPVSWFASAGLVKTGTFEGRDQDTIGFLLSDTHFGDQEMRFLRDRRALAGGTGSPDRDEIIGEINYGFAAAPGVRLLPNIQYVINPDPIYAPDRKTDIPDAIVLGLRVDVHLAQLFGG